MTGLTLLLWHWPSLYLSGSHIDLPCGFIWFVSGPTLYTILKQSGWQIPKVCYYYNNNRHIVAQCLPPWAGLMRNHQLWVVGLISLIEPILEYTVASHFTNLQKLLASLWWRVVYWGTTQKKVDLLIYAQCKNNLTYFGLNWVHHSPPAPRRVFHLNWCYNRHLAPP